MKHNRWWHASTEYVPTGAKHTRVMRHLEALIRYVTNLLDYCFLEFTRNETRVNWQAWCSITRTGRIPGNVWIIYYTKKHNY